MTWGEKIRSMSDEGLMFFLTAFGFTPPGSKFQPYLAIRQMDCYEWLKSEVKDEQFRQRG